MRLRKKFLFWAALSGPTVVPLVGLLELDAR